MNIIIGLLLTLGCILGGFIAMGGHMEVLNQPFELVIIGGAGIGGYIMANSMKVLKDTGKALGEAFTHKIPKERNYLDTLGVLYSLMRDLRTKSRNEIESHIDNPDESSIFQSAPTVLKNKELTAFICDYVRLIIIGNAQFPRDRGADGRGDQHDHPRQDEALSCADDHERRLPGHRYRRRRSRRHQGHGRHLGIAGSFSAARSPPPSSAPCSASSSPTVSPAR